MSRLSHAILALESEQMALEDAYRHLQRGGEPDLSALERVDMLAQLYREIREVKAGITVLRHAAAATQAVATERTALRPRRQAREVTGTVRA